jgi:hypothetical protein
MTVERDFVETYPAELQDRLVLCLQNLNELKEYQPDPMHDIRHIDQVGRNANWIADELELGVKDRNLLNQAVPLHDEGHKYEQMNLLTQSEHGIGSALIALHKTGNLELAKGIALHPYDVLPEGTPDWVYALREADRVDRLGWQGVIFIAHYMGFRHELVNGPLVYQLNFDGKLEVSDPLRDQRHPLFETDFRYKRIMDGSYPVLNEWVWTDYEQNAAEFVKEHIFPFLSERKLIRQMEAELFKVENWVEGEEARGSIPDQLKWKVEPASNPGTYNLFSAKRFNTEQALHELWNYEPELKRDDRKFNLWKEAPANLKTKEIPEDLQLIFRHVMSIRRRGVKNVPLSRRKNIINKETIYFGKEYKNTN